MNIDTKTLLVIGLGLAVLYMLSQQKAPVALPAVQASGLKSYHNAESWEIHRGPDGRITGVDIHRDARAD